MATRPMSGMRLVYVPVRIKSCMSRLLCAVPTQSAAMKPPLHKIVRQALKSVTKCFSVVVPYEKNLRVIGVVQSDSEALSKSVNHFCVIPH